MTSTINKEEIQKFSKLADEWWDVNGKFKPLHMFNPIRIEYILDNDKTKENKRLYGTNLKVKSISLASNFSLISAIANDISYEKIFSFQIEKLCKKDDILILFSVSGNSKNLIYATKEAKKKSVKTISFTGFDGGKLSKLTDYNINFPMANYGIVEDCHITMMHYLSQFLRNTKIKSKNFNKINF